MKYADLRDFIAQLESQQKLKRIAHPVSPHLEMTDIADRVLRAEGPALLFENPTTEGKHANTGKPIAPLAPGFNPQAFTDVAKVDKWFRRNCKDVLSRECTAAEKADVMAYLVNLK